MAYHQVGFLSSIQTRVADIRTNPSVGLERACTAQGSAESRMKACFSVPGTGAAGSLQGYISRYDVQTRRLHDTYNSNSCFSRQTPSPSAPSWTECGTDNSGVLVHRARQGELYSANFTWRTSRKSRDTAARNRYLVLRDAFLGVNKSNRLLRKMRREGVSLRA